MRGGNGYIEEWVNPRLVRDSFLGAIWEGTSNVVGLDVQRAILRERCHEPLLRFIDAKLSTVQESLAAPWVREVRAAMNAIAAAVREWGTLPPAEVELRARPVADALYHVFAAALLLAEGQVLFDSHGDCHKFLVAAFYVKQWLRHRGPEQVVFSAGELEWVGSLCRWNPVPREALTRTA